MYSNQAEAREEEEQVEEPLRAVKSLNLELCSSPGCGDAQAFLLTEFECRASKAYKGW